MSSWSLIGTQKAPNSSNDPADWSIMTRVMREMGTLSNSRQSSGRIHTNTPPPPSSHYSFFLSKLEKTAKQLTHAGGLHEIPPSLPHETVIVLRLKRTETIGLQASLLGQRILSKLLFHEDITEIHASIHSFCVPFS